VDEWPETNYFCLLCTIGMSVLSFGSLPGLALFGALCRSNWLKRYLDPEEHSAMSDT